MNDNAACSRRALLRRLFDAAVASAQPEVCVPAHLPNIEELPGMGRGRVIVIGAGKASAAMAQALEAHYADWPGRLEGLVVTRYGYGAPCQRVEIVEAAHPVPDEAGLKAAQRMLQLVQGLNPHDLVIALISGGGSSLLPLPLPGLTLTDKQAVNRALLQSGATITEMNTVRRHLSAIKGGRLAAACHPARLVTLMMSDVPGDHAIDIASGPTVPDPTTCQDALDLIERYQLQLPEPLGLTVRELLTSGRGESVKPGDPRLQRAEARVVAAPQQALEAAAHIAREAGIPAYILGDSIEGEARDVGRVLGGMALQVAQRGQPFTTPCLLLSGGETTVTVRGDGRGGRNVECLLSMAMATGGHPRIWGLAADTDGVDGLEETAGATFGPETLQRAWSRGIKPANALARNDGHGFFEAVGEAVVTGPTRTNVNDFRAVLIE